MNDSIDVHSRKSVAGEEHVYQIVLRHGEILVLRFPHRVGRYRPGGSLSFSPGCWIRRFTDGLMFRGWECIIPGCGGASTLAPGVTTAARWHYEPQPISNQWMRVGVPHRAGRCRTAGSRVLPRVVRAV